MKFDENECRKALLLKAVGDMANKIEIKLVRSVIGSPQWMRTIVRTLGLRKLQHKRVVNDHPSIRGMVNKVSHLVSLNPAKEQ